MINQRKKQTQNNLIKLSFLFFLFFILYGINVNAIELTNQKLKDYTVELTIQDKVFVEQSFKVVSTSSKPIVPGYAKLVLFEGADPKNIVVNIGGSIKRLDDYELVENKPVIYYDIWRPLSQGEELEVIVNFELENFVQSGLLFQEIDFQIGQLMIPVEEAKFRLKLPSNKYVSYSKPSYSSKFKEVNTDNRNFKVYEYDITPNSKINAEFSFIPLPTLPMHGYWLWAGFALVCMIYFLIQVFSVVKEIKSHRAEN